MVLWTPLFIIIYRNAVGVKYAQQTNSNNGLVRRCWAFIYGSLYGLCL